MKGYCKNISVSAYTYSALDAYVLTVNFNLYKINPLNVNYTII